MAIAIRDGVRYRFRYAFDGPSIHVVRYELESNPSQWMYYVQERGHEDEMELDGEDAALLAAAIRDFESGEVSALAVEGLVAAWFRELRGRE